MIIQPKIRGFICTTSHPIGCKAAVKKQIDYVKSQPKTVGPKKVLVLGASMGYGLASRISAAFSCGAATIGVIFDKPGSEGRTGSSGWYNTAAFEEFANAEGLYAKSINGDAYSKAIKDETIAMIKRDLGQVDMVVYSLAAPRRTMADGTVYSSVLKTTDASYTNKTIDLRSNQIVDITLDPATPEEIEATVKVMGGEDWKEWIQALKDADAITNDAVTVAYSYIGPQLTHPMYFDGSIGRAKQHLYQTSTELNSEFSGLRSYISINKALVTQSSAAIPIVPLYITILYKVMKQHKLHEGCIEQMYRLFHDKLFNGESVPVDTDGHIRLDDYEMRPEIQDEVTKLWMEISDDNLKESSDIDGYWADFYELFGFGVAGVDYDADVAAEVDIQSLK